MKKGIIALAFLALTTTLQAQSEWAGLWRVSRVYQGKIESVYNFYITPKGGQLDVVVYSEDARPMTLQKVEFDPESDLLELRGSNSEKQPLPIQFRLFLKENNQLQGEWAFAHMQLAAPVTGALRGFLAFRENHWDPWLEVENHRLGRYLDITSLLINEAPLDSLRVFRRFWDQEIEKKYYFLLDQWVYGTGERPVAHKREALNALFETLEDEQYRKKLLDLGELAERAIRTTKLLRETDDIGLFLVSFPGSPADFEESVWSRVPTPREEAECACKLDLRERFIFLSPEPFSHSKGGSVLAEQDLVSRSVWYAPAIPPLPIQTYRESLALAYAMEVQGGSWNVSNESVAAARLEFRDLLLEPNVLERKQLEGKLAISLSYGLGLALIQDLRKEHSLNDLFKWNEQEIMKAWQSFLSPTS